MANWLRPVYDLLHKQLCREPVLHADETTLQVLKEPGRSSTSKSYMWLYRTSGCAKQAIVLYEYQPTRKAEHAEAFLKGFSGWLHADGYQGYHKLSENIRVVGCWAHARRKFDEALQTLPKEMQKDSPAAIGEWYCSQLFKLEQALAELTPEERYEKRLEQEKPVLDALLSWANAMQAKTAPKSALGKAIHYLLEQWPYLTRYLEDGRLELSNNRAERSMKPFVMGRKNWLGQAPDGDPGGGAGRREGRGWTDRRAGAGGGFSAGRHDRRDHHDRLNLHRLHRAGTQERSGLYRLQHRRYGQENPLKAT